MLKKILVLMIFFYLLTLFQTSFLVHFPIKGIVLNVVLLGVILINLFCQDLSLGILSAFFGGFFLDFFSAYFFGFWLLLFLALSFFIKFILKKYVQIPEI